jgi:hypothetical protein
MMSMTTPPVAVAAFAAASIAQADPVRTGFAGVKFGWSAYIVPFLFVSSPTLLMQGTPVRDLRFARQIQPQRLAKVGHRGKIRDAVLVDPTVNLPCAKPSIADSGKKLRHPFRSQFFKVDQIHRNSCYLILLQKSPSGLYPKGF